MNFNECTCYDLNGKKTSIGKFEFKLPVCKSIYQYTCYCKSTLFTCKKISRNFPPSSPTRK